MSAAPQRKYGDERLAEFTALSDIPVARREAKRGHSSIATTLCTRAVFELIGRAVSTHFAQRSLGAVSRAEGVAALT